MAIGDLFINGPGVTFGWYGPAGQDLGVLTLAQRLIVWSNGAQAGYDPATVVPFLRVTTDPGPVPGRPDLIFNQRARLVEFVSEASPIQDMGQQPNAGTIVQLMIDTATGTGYYIALMGVRPYYIFAYPDVIATG